MSEDLGHASNPGRAHGRLGQYGQARAHSQTAVAIGRQTGNRHDLAWPLRTLRYVALAEGSYAEAQQMANESLAILRGLGVRSELGRALAASGFVACRLGQGAQGRRYLAEGLQIAMQIGFIGPLMTALSAMALLLADEGRSSGQWNCMPWRLAISLWPTRVGSRTSPGSTSPPLLLPCRRMWSLRRRNAAGRGIWKRRQRNYWLR